MELSTFNKLEGLQLREALFSCCGSEKWVDGMAKQRPYPSEQLLLARAAETWYEICAENDWLEAFSQHPKIGDSKTVVEKFTTTRHFAKDEQALASAASDDVIRELIDANGDYETKFGFIFIVCATGKSAAEMLRLLRDRLDNSKTDELAIAMGEQQKITALRLKKIIDEGDWGSQPPSQLTTHVLNTSTGKPAAVMSLMLLQLIGGAWKAITQGVTNSDGRIADLLPPGRGLDIGQYKIIFETSRYFESQQVESFYPRVEIQFSVTDNTHYHVPLLINPFGYSTYRGS